MISKITSEHNPHLRDQQTTWVSRWANSLITTVAPIPDQTQPLPPSTPAKRQNGIVPTVTPAGEIVISDNGVKLNHKKLIQIQAHQVSIFFTKTREFLDNLHQQINKLKNLGLIKFKSDSGYKSQVESYLCNTTLEKSICYQKFSSGIPDINNIVTRIIEINSTNAVEETFSATKIFQVSVSNNGHFIETFSAQIAFLGDEFNIEKEWKALYETKKEIEETAGNTDELKATLAELNANIARKLKLFFENKRIEYLKLFYKIGFINYESSNNLIDQELTNNEEIEIQKLWKACFLSNDATQFETYLREFLKSPLNWMSAIIQEEFNNQFNQVKANNLKQASESIGTTITGAEGILAMFRDTGTAFRDSLAKEARSSKKSVAEMAHEYHGLYCDKDLERLENTIAHYKDAIEKSIRSFQIGARYVDGVWKKRAGKIYDRAVTDTHNILEQQITKYQQNDGYGIQSTLLSFFGGQSRANTAKEILENIRLQTVTTSTKKKNLALKDLGGSVFEGDEIFNHPMALVGAGKDDDISTNRQLTFDE